MDSTVLNFLYRRPDLYESVYDGSDHAVPRMCEKLFMTYLGHQPTSLLDIGSGTGRDFDYFSRICNDFVGMDYQSGMVGYARKKYPGAEWLVGDMRSFNLDRRFESIVAHYQVFLICHFPRIMLNIYELAVIRKAVECIR